MKSREEKKAQGKNFSKMKPALVVSAIVILAVIGLLFGRLSSKAPLVTPPTTGNSPITEANNTPIETGISINSPALASAEGNSTGMELEKIQFSVNVNISGQSKVNDVYFILTNSTNKYYMWGKETGGIFTTVQSLFTGKYEATFYANDQYGNSAGPVKISFEIKPLFFGSTHISIISGGSFANNPNETGSEGNSTNTTGSEGNETNTTGGGNSTNSTNTQGNSTNSTEGSGSNSTSGSGSQEGSGNSTNSTQGENETTGSGDHGGSGSGSHGNESQGTDDHREDDENETSENHGHHGEHNEEMVVKCSPKEVNKKSHGKWINCKVKGDSDDFISATLNGVSPTVVKENNNGVHLKFARSEVDKTLSGSSFKLTISFSSGTKDFVIPLKTKGK